MGHLRRLIVPVLLSFVCSAASGAPTLGEAGRRFWQLTAPDLPLIGAAGPARAVVPGNESVEAREFEFSGVVSWVSDGDTFFVKKPGKGVRVRLVEIDTPEKSQPYGPEAKSFVMNLVLHQEVLVKVRAYDTYGRALAHVYLPDGRHLNRLLLKEGWAWWYRYYSDDESLGELEREAREAKRGLWVDPDPEAPWDYRWRHRRESEGPAAAAVEAPAP